MVIKLGSTTCATYASANRTSNNITDSQDILSLFMDCTATKTLLPNLKRNSATTIVSGGDLGAYHSRRWSGQGRYASIAVGV